MILVIDTSSSGIGLALEGASPNLVSTKNTHESSPPVEGCGNAAGWFSQARNSQRYYNLPFNPDLTERAKENRKSGSLPEALFWNQLKNKQLLGLDFDRQKIIGNYIVDFFCASIGLVVEIDDKAIHEWKENYDEKRDEYLKSLDLEVIHISAESVLKNPADAAKYLENKIQIWLNHPALRAPLHRRGTYFPTSTQSLDLAPSVEKFLSDNNAKFSDLSAIGVVVGPGSFTGIRLGIAYAKGLAMGLSIPLIGVNKFEIYLHSAADSIVALESGRGDFFVSAHNLEPQIMDIETLETRQMDYPRTIGHKPYNLTNALEIVAQKLNAPVAPVIPLYIRDSYVKTNCTNA